MKPTEKTYAFADLMGINKNILDILQRKQFSHATPIQHQVIPPALDGKDVVELRKLEQEKHLHMQYQWFSVFGFSKNIHKTTVQKQQALVLVPSRELALQVERGFITLQKVLD